MVPAGLLTRSPAALLVNSKFLVLVSGPSSSGDATYGSVPGNPSYPHTQFTIVQNSNNSIRYACVSSPFRRKLLDLDNSGTHSPFLFKVRHIFFN
jgi:hypothetical protein